MAEWVDHAEDHPDVDHLGIRGRRQGAGQAHKAAERNLTDNYSSLQGGQDEEDGEVDLDDDCQVVQGEGIGEVGDDDQDGGW